MRRVNLLKRMYLLIAFTALAGIGWIMAEEQNQTKEIYVNGSASESSEDGTSSNPYKTLQAAIEAANTATEVNVSIKVAAGTYTGSADYAPGKPEQQAQSNDAATFGSFGAITKANVSIEPSAAEADITLQGTLTIKAEGASVSGLKFKNAHTGDIFYQKNSISVFANSVKVTGNSFEVMEIQGTSNANSSCNGVVLYPQQPVTTQASDNSEIASVKTDYKISNNNFNFTTDGHSGIIIREDYYSKTQFGTNCASTADGAKNYPITAKLSNGEAQDKAIIEGNNTYGVALGEEYLRILGDWSTIDGRNADGDDTRTQTWTFGLIKTGKTLDKALGRMTENGKLLLEDGTYNKDNKQTAFATLTAANVIIEPLQETDAAVKINGTFAIKGEGATIKGLKFNYERTSSKYSDKVGISVFADKATIKDNTFTTAQEGGANGIVFYPKKNSESAVTVNYIATGNAFNLKAGSAIVVREDFFSTSQFGVASSEDSNWRTAKSLSNGADLDAQMITAENTFDANFKGEYYVRVTGNYSVLDATGSNAATLTQKYIYSWAHVDNLNETVVLANEGATINVSAATLDEAMTAVAKAITDPNITFKALPTNVTILCKDAELTTNASATASDDKFIAVLEKNDNAFSYKLPATATFYVAENGTGNGTSSAKPLAGKYLQSAINSATKEVNLAAGTYKGNFVMKPGVNVTGAISADGKLISILNGEAKGRVVSYKADATYDKTAYTPEETFSSATVWSNLVITNGKTTNDGGAGAMITKGITLKNCEISDNEAAGQESGNASPKGGGVMCFLGGTIDNCSIHHNKAADGGAGVVLNIFGTISNSDIHANTAAENSGADNDAHSGGINTRVNASNTTGEMLIQNCFVYDNTATNIAGVALNGNAVMVNTLVYGNTSTGVSKQDGVSNHAEGAVTFGTTGAKMVNCTVYNNTNTNGGDNPEANVTIRNNGGTHIATNCIMETIEGATHGTVTYSASKSLTDDATNTHNLKIAADYDPFNNTSAGDYTLADGTPYLDKGNSKAYAETYPKTDLGSTTRIKGNAIDFGAYEAVYKAPTVTDEKGLTDELAKQPEEIVIEAPAGSGSEAKLELENAIEVNYPVTIKASDEKPVTITVEEGKSAFTTTTGGELTLDNVTIETKTPGSSSGTGTAPVIKVAADTKATLQNSSLEVPATVTAIEAAGTMEISNVALTIMSTTSGTPAPAIKVASNADVTIKDVNITDGTIEVAGALNIAPTKEGNVVFTQTTAEKAALDLKSGAVVVVDNAQFTGKAITAEDGAQITLTGCNFTSPKTNRLMSAPLTKAVNEGQVIKADGANIIASTFSGITGEGSIISGKSLTVKSCLFYDNADVVMINIEDGNNTIVANNTCVNNKANAQAAVINNAASSAVIKNNILWTNATEAIAGSGATSDKITHNALKTAAASIEGHSLQLTSFNAIRFDGSNYPYQLHKDSPVAAVAGDATGITSTEKDILGNSRLSNGKVHLGAYESVYTPTPSTGGDDDDTPTTPDVSSITLDKTTLTLHAQQSYQLKATVKPADAPQSVTWSSSDPTIATVAKDGTVKALKAGTATITAEADGGHKATCKVTVDTATGIEELLSQTVIEGRDGQIQIRPAAPVQVLIVNMAGSIVADRIVNSSESFTVSQGVYIVRLSNSGKTTTQKVSVR